MQRLPGSWVAAQDADYEFIWGVETAQDPSLWIGERWAAQSPRQLHELSVRQGVRVRVFWHEGERLGLALLDQRNDVARHCRLSVAMDDVCRVGPRAFMAVGVLLDELFTDDGMRKIFLNISSANTGVLASVAGIGRVEASLPNPSPGGASIKVCSIDRGVWGEVRHGRVQRNGRSLAVEALSDVRPCTRMLVGDASTSDEPSDKFLAVLEDHFGVEGLSYDCELDAVAVDSLAWVELHCLLEDVAGREVDELLLAHAKTLNDLRGWVDELG